MKTIYIYSFGKDNQWVFLTNMSTPRVLHGAVSVTDGIWVSGGQQSENSTEFIYLNGSRSDGPKLSAPAWGHCVVQHEGIVFSIGGANPITNSNYKTVSIYSAHEGMKYIADGPSMNKGRNNHACGIFKSNVHNGHPVIVVAGGSPQQDVGQSCEYLDFTVPNAKWEMCSKSLF